MSLNSRQRRVAIRSLASTANKAMEAVSKLNKIILIRRILSTYIDLNFCAASSGICADSSNQTMGTSMSLMFSKPLEKFKGRKKEADADRLANKETDRPK